MIFGRSRRDPDARVGSGEEFGRNSLNVIVARVLLTASVLGTSLITARWLGPRGRGEYSVAILVAVVVGLIFDVFSSGALYYSARADFPRRRILGNAIVLAFLSGLMGFLLCLALIPLAGGSLFGDVPARYLVIALAAVPLGLVLSDVSAIMRGAGDFFGYNVVLVAQSAIPLVLIAAVLIGLNGGPGAAIGATVVGSVLVAAGAMAWCRRLLGGIDWRPDLAYAKRAGSYGIRAQLGTVLAFLGYRIDVLLVNGYLNAAAAGFYSVALATAERAQTVGEAAATVLYPRIAAERAADRRRGLTPIVARIVLWTTIVLAAGFFLLAHWLVLLLYSKRFDQAVKPTEILLLSMVASAPQRVFSADIAGRGRPLINSYVAALSLALNVALNIVLIPRYGIPGAAWASVASYTVAAALSCGVYLRLSGNSLASVVVPTREDFTMLRRVALSLMGRPRPT